MAGNGVQHAIHDRLTRPYPGQRLQPDDRAEWARMRALLWPGDHEMEISAHFAGAPAAAAIFVADRGDGRLGGFVEMGERAYAEGCDTSPVA